VKQGGKLGANHHQRLSIVQFLYQVYVSSIRTECKRSSRANSWEKQPIRSSLPIKSEPYRSVSIWTLPPTDVNSNRRLRHIHITHIVQVARDYIIANVLVNYTQHDNYKVNYRCVHKSMSALNRRLQCQ